MIDKFTFGSGGHDGGLGDDGRDGGDGGGGDRGEEVRGGDDAQTLRGVVVLVVVERVHRHHAVGRRRHHAALRCRRVREVPL